MKLWARWLWAHGAGSIVGLGLALAAIPIYGYHQRAIGALNEKLRVAHATTDSLKRFPRVDSIRFAKHDTVKLFRRIAGLDTIIQHLVDTAFVHHSDTIKVPVSVLTAADSNIKACRVTIQDCATGWNSEKALRISTERELTLVRKSIPSAAWSWTWRAAAFGAGILIGRGM